MDRSNKTADILHRRLDETARQACRVARWTAWLQGCWILLAAIAVLGLADLLFTLPDGLRHATRATGLITIFGAVAAGVLAGTRIRRRRAEFFATLLERTHPADDNALINAVQFSHAQAGGTLAVASEALVNQAIRQGYTAADIATPLTAVDRTDLGRNRRILFALLAALILSGLFWPAIWAAILPRLADPAGDHPPYCPIRFAVVYESTNPDGRVYEGDSVKVRISTSGRTVPEQAWLELATAGGPRKVELFRRSNHEWYTRFDDVRQAMVFRVHVPEGYSRLQYLQPLPVPAIRSAKVRYEPPADWRQPSWDERIEGQHHIIRAPVGVNVTLTLGSDQPLSGGPCTLTSAQAGTIVLRMNRVDNEPNQVRITFPLEHAGQLIARITDENGHLSKHTLEAELRPIETSQLRDAPPPANDLNSIAKQAEQLQNQLAKAAPDSSEAKAMQKQLTELNARQQSTRQAAKKTATRPTAATTSRPTSAPSSQATDQESAENAESENAGGHSLRSAQAAAADKNQSSIGGGGGSVKNDKVDSVIIPGESTVPGVTVEIMRTNDREREVGLIRGEGVPGRYKELTEAYFRRIAEENR